MRKPKTHLVATKEEVIKYYIEENHNIKETAAHFNCGVDALSGFCKRNGISKKPNLKPKTHLTASKEEVVDYYINQNHDQRETANYFNCNIDALYAFLKRNNINKDRSLVNELESRNKLRIRDSKTEHVTKEKLKAIIDSKIYSKEEIAKHFNINTYKLNYLLKKYNLDCNIPYGDNVSRVIKEYGKEELFDYYVNKKYSQKQLKELLNVTQDELIQILKYYSLNKIKPFAKLVSNIDIKDLFDYYVRLNHTKEETISYFELTEASFDKLLRHYSILKKESASALRARITKEELEDYYINQNKDYNEVCSHFNVTLWDLKNILKEYGLPLNNNPSNSTPNRDFKALLESRGFKENEDFTREFIIERKRYDFKIKNYLIELNPTYTHNSTKGWMNLGKPLAKNYHQDKTNTALKNNYECIHIWDWDNINAILEDLLFKPELKEKDIDNLEITDICLEDISKELNYLPDYMLPSNKYIGLKLNNKLIAFITFKNTKKKENSWELIEYFSLFNIKKHIVEMFNYFINKYNPNFIVYYKDNSKYNPVKYITEVMELKYAGRPSLHWYNIKTNQHILNKDLSNKRDIKKLMLEIDNFNCKEFMISQGFLEVYDCGKSLYVWKKEIL